MFWFQKKAESTDCHIFDPTIGERVETRLIGNGSGQVPKELYDRFKDSRGHVYILITYTGNGKPHEHGRPEDSDYWVLTGSPEVHVVPESRYYETVRACADEKLGHFARISLGVLSGCRY